MEPDKMTALLARAASGDTKAAAEFMRARAVRVEASERVRGGARAAAWRMIRASD